MWHRAIQACGVVAVLLVASACGGKKDNAIAELTKAEGPVERQEAAKDWKNAVVGTKFFLGDAARTADGGAELKLGASAQIAMQPHTILRFGPGKAGAAKIAVELGAIDLKGTGNVGLDIGDAKLADNSAIRISANAQGKNTVTLTLGNATIAGLDGDVVTLQLGKVFDPGIGKIKVEAVDAGVPDAAPPPPDAGVPEAGDAKIDVKGKHAESLAPGETKWTAVPEGESPVAKGAKIRLGNGTTAKLVANGTGLELAGGSRVAFSADAQLALEAGGARVTVPSNAEGTIGVPGGEVAFKGTSLGPAAARLDVAGHETKVQVIRPSVKLTGSNNAVLEMGGGTATISQSGAIHPLETIPNFFDIETVVGSDTSSFTIHDPRPPTAVKFNFNGKCPGGGVIEMDHDPHFRTAKVSAGKESANMSVQPGAWSWRLRCGEEGAAVASGRIVVVRDDGHRPLPPKPGKNPIDADGRNYTISYQSSIPIVEFHYRGGAGAAFKLHLATGGAEETYDGTTPVIEVPGTKLKEATYTYWFDHDGVKQDKVTTLKITFDQTAPQVYIEAPPNGQPFGSEIEVRGAVLPGWTAKVDVVEIPVDKTTRRFAAKVPPPPGNALAIRLSHPQHGVHLYLRRGK